MKASHCKYTLNFKRPGGTSRGILHTKDTYFLRLEQDNSFGLGECGLFRGLSADDRPDYELKLQEVCSRLEQGESPDVLLEELADPLSPWPSICFGLEQALRSLESRDPMILFDSEFTSGNPIPINGLVWMGSSDFMLEQIGTLLDQGYRCLKLKIGALEFDTELNLLQGIRKQFSPEDLEIRVDANGAFSPEEAIEKLKQLSAFELHSIEQPIAAGQVEAMAGLCEQAPFPIALDEELIGIQDPSKRSKLLATIRPQYIILKPSLVGGYKCASHWISESRKLGIDWWVTSALESNIGLNAIAQWTATLGNPMPQGLGTGSLFTNNFTSPLLAGSGELRYRPEVAWDMEKIKTLCT
ncbi:o-succinylbenzoate synthase [Robiginitalea myxolifaciens]|uniref:O-succinylbenzoate synthase n=1 Tax=Robiginitalea myxolifaciens TaxID=400055 RepID=A0A1I6GUE9_9FLAO|nr:o-succinylbenzoate synthase [Robiginitalea myxolifaciens]SFR45687.1 o-succinylbenzoate synthase [Robiginitalea myxolifaciens]